MGVGHATLVTAPDMSRVLLKLNRALRDKDGKPWLEKLYEDMQERPTGDLLHPVKVFTEDPI